MREKREAMDKQQVAATPVYTTVWVMTILPRALFFVVEFVRLYAGLVLLRSITGGFLFTISVTDAVVA